MYCEFVINVIPKELSLKVTCDYHKNFVTQIKQKYNPFFIKFNPRVCFYTLEYKDTKNCFYCKSFRKQKVSRFVQICYDLDKKIFCYSCPENIFLFDSLLRVVVSMILIDNRGCLLHSAGVVRNGYVELYAGKSGSGKSTLAKKFHPKDVLSDELCPVWVKNGKVYSCKSIFYSEVKPYIVTQKLLQVKKFFFFNKKCFIQSTNQQLDFKQSVVFLLKNIFFVINDTQLGKKVLNTVYEIASLTKCYEI